MGINAACESARLMDIERNNRTDEVEGAMSAWGRQPQCHPSPRAMYREARIAD